MVATTADDTTFQKENFGLTRDEYNRGLEGSNMSEKAFREVLEANQQREVNKVGREIVKNVNELKGENPYSLLQEGAEPGQSLSPNSSDEQIKKAIRNLSNKYHPDKNPGDHAAEEKFKQVNSAKELLGNSASREQFDAWSLDHPDAFKQTPPQEEPKAKTKPEPEPEAKAKPESEAEPKAKPQAEPEPHSTGVSAHMPENAKAPVAERVTGGANVGVAAVGVIMDGQAVVQNLREGDYQGAALSGASLGVNSVNMANAVEQAAPGLISNAVEKNIPTFKKAAETVVEKAAPLVEKVAAPVLGSKAATAVTGTLEAVGLKTGQAVLGAAGTTVVGVTSVYQTMKEDEGQNRAQKAVDGIVIVGAGTATGAVMSGGLVVGGAAATGATAVAATVATIAAPIVVVGELAYADKLIMDTTRIYTEQDGIFKSQQDLGHLKSMVSQMRDDLAKQGVDVDKHGNIDLSNEKNRAAVSKLLMERSAKDGETMQKNDSVLPLAFRSGDAVDAYNTAKSDQDFVGAAQDELRHLNTGLAAAKTADDKTKVLAEAKVKAPAAPEVAAAPAVPAATTPAATTPAATAAAATTPAASTTASTTGAPAGADDDNEPEFVKTLKKMLGPLGEIIGAIIMAITGMFDHHNNQAQASAPQTPANHSPTHQHQPTVHKNQVHDLHPNVLIAAVNAGQGATVANHDQGQHVHNDATVSASSLSSGPSAKAFGIT